MLDDSRNVEVTVAMSKLKEIFLFAEELGKPGMTEEKIAELISGESEMLREAHVMG